MPIETRALINVLKLVLAMPQTRDVDLTNQASYSSIKFYALRGY